MQFRSATAHDAAVIRQVASRSLEASYSLSPQTIEGAVEQWYADETLTERLADEHVLLILLETDDGVVGFAEGELVDVGGDGDISWLHVDPDYRGMGYARALFDEASDRLRERGAERLRGRVLRENPQGNEFYEHFGLTKAGESTVRIDGSTYIENIYVEEPNELASIDLDDGRRIFIDHNDAERGSVRPFYAAYLDPERTTRYGYACDCGSLDIAMDSMGRLECNACGNQRKPSRWDAAYL